jgi:YD repeat-containing protein
MSVALPNGSKVEYGYDDSGRVNSIKRTGLGEYKITAFNSDGQPRRHPTGCGLDVGCGPQ